ncbi:33880_t:CDS:2, partial [Gigaspora margarita]
MLRQDVEQVEKNLQTAGVDNTLGIGYTLIKEANLEVQIWLEDLQ